MVRFYKKALGSKNYRNYDPIKLELAVAKVRSGQMSYREASERYNIPKSTINDKIKGSHPKKHGGQTTLTKEEETQFVKAILLSAEWGFPLTELDIRQIVQHYLTRRGRAVRQWKNNLPGTTWIKNFLSRNQVLTVRLAQNIKRSRAEVNHTTISEYFSELKKSVEGVPAENIVNYDETNFSDDPGKPKVVCKRGSKHCDRVIDSSKTSISVMMAASASGELLPPFVVYKAKHRYEEWEQDGPPGSRYSISKSGWFESTTFVEWFRQILLPYFRQKDGSKILIGDNLSSHITLDVIQDCQKYDIKFILLPPNSTHLCQPLDVAYFAPMKKHWRSILTDWKMKKKGPFQKSDFPRLLQQTLEAMKASSKKNILSGFRACGIFPYDAEAVLKRLPSRKDMPAPSDTPMAPTPLVESDVSATLLNFLQTSRMPEVRPKARRKRINVAPGQPVKEKDFSQKNETLSEPTPKPTTKDVVIEEHDSSDSDSLPLIRPILPERETDNILSSDSEDIPLSFLKDKMKIKETESCDILIPKVNMFAIVKVPLAFCSKYKYYVGLVLEEIKNVQDPSSDPEFFLVRFLRKKKAMTMNFFFIFQ